MKRIFTVLLTLSIITLSLFSCGGSYDPAEVTAALEALAPRAYELYMLVYSDAIEYEAEGDSNDYHVVTDPSYTSLTDIESALDEVFTPAYVLIIGNTAFTGISTDEGAIGPKFKVNLDGVLVVKPSVTEDFALPREFDTSTIEVVKQNAYRAILSICPVGSDERVEVTLQKVQNEWKIDSPLY